MSAPSPSIVWDRQSWLADIPSNLPFIHGLAFVANDWKEAQY